MCVFPPCFVFYCTDAALMSNSRFNKANNRGASQKVFSFNSFFKCSFTFQTIFHWFPHCCWRNRRTTVLDSPHDVAPEMMDEWPHVVIKTLERQRLCNSDTLHFPCKPLRLRKLFSHSLTRSPLWWVNQSRRVAALQKQTQRDSREHRKSLDAALSPTGGLFPLNSLV